eukprot:m.161395 g.161395  ORF g.161395 m.161395 type:complete len:567 (+) comp17643_c0_seq3:142-1842(+)
MADTDVEPRRALTHAVATGHIALTAVEQQVFRTCLDALSFHHQSRLKKHQERHGDGGDSATDAPELTVLRVAGGWTRDKLLGRESDDIDFTVDNISGVEFAEALKAYLAAQGSDEKVTTKRLIAQSQHLEVATFELHGRELDVCRLRKEVYGDSRIPEITAGTAVDDALRRDFTINTLFYNITEDVVEDFSDTGLSDLEYGVIRTPIPTEASFAEDPLRAMRAARFAARFGYRFAREVRAAAETPRFRQLFKAKVSAERCGKELEKTIKSVGNPVGAIQALCEFGIFDLVFALPCRYVVDEEHPPLPLCPVPLQHLTWPEIGKISCAVMNTMHSTLHPNPPRLQALGTRNYTREQRKILLLASVCAPFWGYQLPKVTKPWLAGTLCHYVLQVSLKLPGKDCLGAANLLQHAQTVLQVCQQWAQLLVEQEEENRDPKEPPNRLLPEPTQLKQVPSDLVESIGRLMLDLKEQWPLALDLGDVLFKHCSAFPIDRFQPSALLLRWIKTVSGLVGCWKRKPCFDGRAMVSKFKLKGSAVGVALHKQTTWMLTHPNGTAEECEAWLRTQLD